LALSAMNRLPSPSTAIPRGAFRGDVVAGTSSRALPDWPVPATVPITPAMLTLRIRWLKVSAMNRLPSESTTQALG